MCGRAAGGDLLTGRDKKRGKELSWDDRGENGWFQAERAACALLIRMPGGKVWVTGSLLKQTAEGEKTIFYYFLVVASKIREEKQEINQVF